MQPVVEAYWLSEEWRAKNLRYYPWHGRGFVQLTWQRNYVRAGKALDMDLITDPDRVMEPDISVKILVRGCMEGWFTGRSIPDYITLQRSDFVNARRVVNGTDRAENIAKIAEKYDSALLAEGYGEVNSPAVDHVPVTAPKAPQDSLWAALASFFQSLFKKG
tara:strand:+ start:344 stop:829 length:486 start_codon:yes stop_codon:yes gene_type:complete